MDQIRNEVSRIRVFISECVVPLKLASKTARPDIQRPLNIRSGFMTPAQFII